MKTLAQLRNGVLKKFNKKRKPEFSSLVMSSGSKLLKQTDQKRKSESTREKFYYKRDPHKGNLNDSSKKRNLKGCRGDQSLCSSSKSKKDRGGSQTVGLKRRRKQKKKKVKVVPDVAAQLQRRARYLLVKMKLEQNLLDAYTGEGWKGQSREKIKPEKELQRAKIQIQKCKLGLRDTVQQLDLLGSVGQIDDSLIDPDGSVHHEHIFCKKCKSQEVSEDNDIILCDGTCHCAFHQNCVDPPLATKDIPPEGEGWLCKYCNCKMEILDAMNAYLGTQFSADTTWQDVFKEEALLSNVGTRDFNTEEEWPSDESDDNDYDPDDDEHISSNKCSMEDSDSQEETSTSSSCCSLESEVLYESGYSVENCGLSSNSLHQNCVIDSNDNETIIGPRKRSAVDYRKLYDEMFGKEKDNTTDDLVSEDEDWNPSKRTRKEKESDVASTLVTLCELDVEQSDWKTSEVGNDHIPYPKARKPLARIPCEVVQKLRQAFAENELPSRDVKKKLSELVGLEYKKVNKWFKNARYMALKNKRERDTDHSPKISNLVVDKIDEAIVSKSSSMPISSHKKKHLKKVSWKANLITLISPPKKQKKKTTLDSTKANLELSDNMSLKKHLLDLKARSRQKLRVNLNTMQFLGLNAEKQMEHLCWIQAKVWKLKQVLSTIQKFISNESDDLSLKEQKVVYVPIARLQEKE